MGWARKNGVIVKDGCYLVPITPNEYEADVYALTPRVLRNKIELYMNHRPLLIPVARGGYRTFLPFHGEFRAQLGVNDHTSDVPFASITITTYDKAAINSRGESHIDDQDVQRALTMLRQCSEGILLDDVCDSATTISVLKGMLSPAGKPLVTVTPHIKPENHPIEKRPDFWLREFYSIKIDGQTYPIWIVYPHEREDHQEPGLWQALFPYLNENLDATRV